MRCRDWQIEKEIVVNWVVTFIGALFFTFLASRAFLRLLPEMADIRLRIMGAHLLSFIVLGGIAALVKAHVEAIQEAAALPYILPQLVWLIVDLYVAGLLRRR